MVKEKSEVTNVIQGSFLNDPYNVNASVTTHSPLTTTIITQH